MSRDNDENSGDRNRDYEVGDGRPPRHTRFRAGVSGNPRGRPKGSVSLRTQITRELRQFVTLIRKGRPVKIRKAGVIAMQIVDAAAKGDLKAAMVAIRFDDEAGIALSKASAEEAFAPMDQDNLRFIADRIQGLIQDGD